MDRPLSRLTVALLVGLCAVGCGSTPRRGPPRQPPPGGGQEGLPRQEDIDSLFRRADGARLVSTGLSEERQVVRSFSAAEVAAISGLLRIRVGEAPFAHMCTGDFELELTRRGELLGAVGLHHAEIVRMAGWRSDARLDEPLPLLEWFARHGAPALLAEHRRRLEADARRRRTYDAWAAAMPPSLRPIVEDLEACLVGCPEEEQDRRYRAALAVLLRGAASETEVVEALAAWYASGAGPWSGFPSYEEVAQGLLSRLGSPAVAEALLSGRLSDRALVGVGRYFAMRAMWWPGEVDPLPMDVRQRVLEEVRRYERENPAARSTGDSPVERLEAAFDITRDASPPRPGDEEAEP